MIAPGPNSQTTPPAVTTPTRPPGPTKDAPNAFARSAETHTASARPASVSAGMLALYSKELAHHPIEFVRTVLHSLCLAQHREWEPAYPALPTILAAIEAEERKQNRFVPCGGCMNGMRTVNQKGQVWDDKRDFGNSDRASRYCACYVAWLETRSAMAK
jgi:hypothetical protein